MVEHLENEDGTSWYDLFSDGWLVQGGHRDTIDYGSQMWVVLPKEYENSDYYVNWKAIRSQGNNPAYLSQSLDQTPSSFKMDDFMNNGSKKVIWITMGYAA